MLLKYSFVVVFITTIVNIKFATSENADLLVVTVATEANDGYQRFMKSAKLFNIPVQVLGLGDKWMGGDMTNTVGGGQKIRLLRKAMEEHKDKTDLVVMFVDSYDVVFTNSTNEAVSSFRSSADNILFSAEGFCWPDKTLADKYPKVAENEKRFLNSGSFMGYAPFIHKLVTYEDIQNTGDDQLYYTKIFLQHKDDWKMALDTKSTIFQCLHGALDEVTVKYSSDGLGYLQNVKTNTAPIVIHANGPIKPQFNGLTNYLNKNWNPTKGCQQCDDDILDLSAMDLDNYPTILLAVFVEGPTPFIKEFFERLGNLSYPKHRMDVSILYGLDLYKPDVVLFKEKYRKMYNSMTLFNPTDFESIHFARNAAITLAIEKKVDFLFAVDSIVQFTNTNTLQLLVRQNKSIMAPMLTRVGKLWSNFWGALSKDNYYARSDDYMDIAQNVKLGIWNVPHITDAYLIQKAVLPKLTTAFTDMQGSDPDIAFTSSARANTIFMYVTNMEYFGHLTVPDNTQTSHLHNDLWEIVNNPFDWEARYIHENYSRIAAADVPYTDIAQPCPDVFWFPILSETACRHFVEEMENFGQWSDGNNKDARLEGGYENVPTRDIHMRQVDYEENWMHFLLTYIHPIQKKVFQGYDDIPTARMNFIVRYRPDEQPFLRAHHDSSSYSLNIALNRAGIDFQGGGTRFIRYECQLTAARLGWVLMHPGRVTHLHEGLTTTNGTRYIFVTFVNP